MTEQMRLATRDALGRVTFHPEALEVTPVDEELFRRITTGAAHRYPALRLQIAASNVQPRLQPAGT